MARRRASSLGFYRRFLAKVARRFTRIARRNADAVRCQPGCFGCCVGLFEITALDAALAAEGLARLPADRREAIRRRGEAIARRIAPQFPGDPATFALDLRRENAWDAFFEKTAAIACPFLVPENARVRDSAPKRARSSRWPRGFVCAIYAHRPHTCRTFGLPLADRGRIVSEPCRLNFRRSSPPEMLAAALPAYAPEDDAIARSAEARLGLDADAATILPAVAANLFNRSRSS